MHAEKHTTTAPTVPTAASHVRSTAIGSIQGLSAQAAGLVLGFVASAFLTRSLGPERYGLYSIATTVVLWLNVSIGMGLGRTTVAFVAQDADWRATSSTMLRVELAANLVAAALLFASAPLLAAWLHAPELTLYLRLFALGRPVSGLSGVHSSTLVGRGRFGPWALLTVVYWAARLVLAVLLVGLGLSVEGAILATLGASLVQVLGARLFVQPSWGKRAAFPLRRVASYALPLMVHGLGMRLFGYLDIPVLQALGGDPALAGYYSAAQSLSIVPFEMLGQAFSPPLCATLARLVGQGQSGQARDVVSGAMRWLSWMLPFGGVAMGMAHEVVHWVYGASYLPAARLLGLLFFAGWAWMTIWLSCAMLTAVGKPGWTPVLTTPLPLVVLMGHWLLIPRLGATGAALSTLATALLGVLAALWAMYRTWSILPPVASILRGTIVGALAYAVGSAFPTAGWAVPLKLAVLAGAVVVGLALIGEISSQDMILLRSLLPAGGHGALREEA